MDETIAAMVLTSLSVSPSSPSVTCAHYREHLDGHYPYPDSHLSSSVASSGFYSGHSERDDQSPPLPPLSESAPAVMRYEPSVIESDDDSSNSSGRLLINEDSEDTFFKCTWRGCNQASATRNAIERHIRRAHFDRDSDLELTDNEEDFHYIEVDEGTQSINTMTQYFAAMQTSSPGEGHRSRHDSEDSQPLNLSNKAADAVSHNVSDDTVADSLANGNGMCDHDYQRKMLKHSQASSVPATGTLLTQGQAASLPIAIDGGQIQRSLSWHIHSSPTGSLVSPPQRSNKLTPQERLYQHQAQSPKSSIASSTFKVSQHRRARSEVRKCRKVYGMENRDQWCTQCKWKKACTRFID
ncbi:unnamed protein product [Candidula unifasciata]|uniref:C2H2-type domain-containing protein n=1 Tax=Candidula unifasciata TaxID=100452 RepID=A0A8S3ZE74_9EUPU|nr:unnamed protein product [Candidula unifasciata]